MFSVTWLFTQWLSCCSHCSLSSFGTCQKTFDARILSSWKWELGMSPCEVPWTGVGEGEGSLPWSSICYSPEEWDRVSFWVVSGEHPLCLRGGGREKQLSVYNSRKPTHAGIPKIDSHEEHPASSDLSSLRTSMNSLWSHAYCNMDHYHPRTYDVLQKYCWKSFLQWTVFRLG